MSENSSAEKTEKPTPKKLEDARKKGQVAQSQDVNKLFITIVGFELLIALKDNFLEKVKTMINVALSLIDEPFLFSVQKVSESILFIGLTISFILILAVIVARFLAAWVQFGFLVAPESLKPDMQKINPVTNAKNMFKMKKFVEFLANIAKAIVLSIVIYWVIQSKLPEIVLSAVSTLDLAVEIGADVFIFAARLSLFIFFISCRLLNIIYDYF